MVNPLTFTAGVVTSQGTSYILMITDLAAFTSFGNTYLNDNDPDNYNNFQFNIFGGTRPNGFGIIETASATANELNFLNLLASSNTGLTLFKGNAAMTEFDAVGLNTDGTELTKPCPNF